MSTARKTKVAIVGGGCAGIATAFELTRPEHRGQYEVTVYQLGWRLGGKGASGRGPADRIEEHGLHLWMGFYENAFRLMRECYAELGRDPKKCRIARWEDAFVPDPFCGVMDRSPDGRWSPWVVTFPPLPGLPGDPDAARWTVTDYLQRTITLVRTLFEAIQTRPASGAPGPRQPGPVGSAPSEIEGLMQKFLRYGGFAGLGGLIELLRILDEAARMLPRFQAKLILDFHEAVSKSARAELERLIENDDGLRRLWEILDLTLAAIHGIIRCGLPTHPKGFDAIDEHDCRKWLEDHGASERSTNGAFLTALYDLAFAYEDGDVKKPMIAAGQAMRGALRAFFTYRGAFFWKMQSGMGDVVFAPFYEVLKRRGVDFRFFHRLENVGLSDEGESPHVRTLEFDVQANLARGSEYRPLVDVRGLPCWPSEPRWEQLANGVKMRREKWNFESHWDKRKVGTKTLHVGKDFDFVVLAVGLGAVPYVCSELIKRETKWEEMVAKVKTVPTQALQLWLREDAQALGWKHPPVNISGFVEPFDTWADMSHLVREESYSATVKSIAYFCSVLPDTASTEAIGRSDYPESRRAEVRENAIRFLERDVRELWPDAVGRGGRFRWDLLASHGKKRRGKPGPPLIETQYYRANVEPSDRYCLSLPDTLKLRISPLDRTYDNLTVAGDWTACGFPEGCVEAAVMSGRLAAHALTKLPRLEDIVGYDHP